MGQSNAVKAGSASLSKAGIFFKITSKASFRSFVLAAALAVAMLPASLTASQAETKSVSVVVGKTKTVRVAGSYVDLVVGNPAIADVRPMTDRSFYIHGKKIGATNISIYNAQKRLIRRLEIEVGYNGRRLQNILRSRIKGARIRVASVNGHVELMGTVPSAPQMRRALQIAKQFTPNIINSLEVSGSQQVMLEVRFIEASRNAGRDIGINWNVVGRRFSAATSGAASGNIPFGTFLGNILNKGTKIDVLINALEQKGLGRRLAEPNLVAMSGETASFLAGGEFPFPVAGAPGQPPSVQFKKFGVGLKFTPTVLANGLISLKIEPEVSQIDKTTNVAVGSGIVPALIVRRASTTVQLKNGQSFAIAGLLQSVTQDNAKQLPWLGNVPVIGTLFRSAAFERKETDLAIIITPRLVKPGAPNQRIATPLDNSRPANDVDRFLLGRQQLTLAQARRARRLKTPMQLGHILDLGGKR